MEEKSRFSLQNMVQMSRESIREGSWSLLPRLAVQRGGIGMTTGIETTAEEVAAEAWTGMIVIGTTKETEVLVVAVTVPDITEVVDGIVMMMKGATEADLLKGVLLFQGEVGVHVEVFLPARESHLAVHLIPGVTLQTGAVQKDLLFLLIVPCLLAQFHHVLVWMVLVVPLLAS